MSKKERMIPETYVEDILATINDYLPFLEEGLDKIEREIELQGSPEISEEVKSFMNAMGYPNMARLEELKERRLRLKRIQTYLST